jgi:hypothetical protein
MPRRLVLCLSFCLTLFAAGCGSDDPVPAVDPLVTATLSIFPDGGVGDSAASMAGLVAEDADRGDAAGAEQAAFQLTSLTLLELSGARLRPGVTPARLDEFITQVFTAAGLPAPPLEASSFGPEGIVAVIPADGGTFTSANLRAGLSVPAGAVAKPVLLVADRLPDASVYTPGKGPLPTSLDQWPLFYQFTLTPSVTFSADAIIGFCQVTEPGDPFYVSDAVQARLQLAHPDPANPAAIELLVRVDAPFLECDGVTANAVRGAMSALARRPGIGGRVRKFSPFGAVDPFSEEATLTGLWNGTYTPNGTTLQVPISLSLTQTGNNLAGTYAIAGTPRFGSLSATREGTSLVNWTMTQQPGCPGTWSGSAVVSNTGNTLTVTYTGSDCTVSTPITGVAVVNRRPSGVTPPVITTTTLPSGTVGQAYTAPVAVAGGNGTNSWTTVGGLLPGGLQLNTTSGVISGTPQAQGTFTFTVQVASDGATDQKALSITIGAGQAPVTITSSTLPTGTINQAYSQQLAASGGTGSYTWSLVTGTLPSGIILTTGGLLTGTPVVSGSFPITVQASSGGGSAQRQFTLTVNAAQQPVTIGAATPPGGTTGAAYSAQLGATGGTGTYVWTVVAGTLPPGIGLGGGGLLAGTPTAAGSYTFTVRSRSRSLGSASRRA